MENKKITIDGGGDSFPLQVISKLFQSQTNAPSIVFSSNPTPQPTLSSNPTIKGTNMILRYLARQYPELGLYGQPADDPFVNALVDEWVDAAFELQLNSSDQARSEFCARLNHHLLLRTFLADFRLTLADICVWSALKGTTEWNKFLSAEGANKYPHVQRWFNFVQSLPSFQASATPSEASKEVPSQQAVEKVKKNITGSQGNFSKLELVGAKRGAVVTRFPPEPSGYLHIGHAKAALLNHYFAKSNDGKLVVRFDDTNPAKEKAEYEESILQDLATLGIKPDHLSRTSDYFGQFIKFAEQLIRDKLAYVDDTPQEQMKTERFAGIPSKCREASVEENLRLWKEMVDGTEKGVKCVLRAKIDMTSKNKALRDPSLYRVVLSPPHHRTGSQFKVYPIYDFACPIVDSIEGVTHSLRSAEYHDRNPLYYWVVDAVKLRRPMIQDFSRLNFAYTLLSKRKLQWFVDRGLVSGWDDPRFPTIQGMLRRGLTVEALREFVLSQGASKNITLMEPDKLWAVNKKIIDPIVPRYTAIAAHRCPLMLSDGPTTPVHKSVLRHKKNLSLGNKVITYFNVVLIEKEDANMIETGEEVTLMDWGNVVVDSINRDDAGNVVQLNGHLHLDGSVKDTKKKLNWLADTGDNVDVVLVTLDHLITKKKLEEGDKFEDFVNPKTIWECKAWGDPNLRNLKRGERIQLERRGYYICDEPYLVPSNPMRLIQIPDGHTAKQQSILSSGIEKPDKKN